MKKKPFDVIGIGLGPFNLGMAALLDRVTEIHSCFFEQKNQFEWHPGMLIDGTTLQVPFFADLVSMIDVQSPFSFLNYLQQHNRLYHFYFLEKFHISRKEYNLYCQWVADQLNTCKFSSRVTSIDTKWVGEEKYYEVTVENLRDSTYEQYLTKNIVLGIGSTPKVPNFLKQHMGETVFHSADYLNYMHHCLSSEKITVIGSGQSAAEIYFNLLCRDVCSEISLHWFTRAKGFLPMEYSKLGLEYFSPDYIEYFYNLSQDKKDSILPQQGLLYKGISSETIANIYDKLYERTLKQEQHSFHMQALTELRGIEKKGSKWLIHLYQIEEEVSFQEETDCLILATGYETSIPTFIKPLEYQIQKDKVNRYEVNKNYSLKLQSKEGQIGDIYIQNGEMHTHGVGAPDLGLGAYRNSVIINSIAGKEVYKLQEKNIFQSFGCKKMNIKQLV